MTMGLTKVRADYGLNTIYRIKKTSSKF